VRFESVGVEVVHHQEKRMLLFLWGDDNFLYIKFLFLISVPTTVIYIPTHVK